MKTYGDRKSLSELYEELREYEKRLALILIFDAFTWGILDLVGSFTLFFYGQIPLLQHVAFFSLAVAGVSQIHWSWALQEVRAVLRAEQDGETVLLGKQLNFINIQQACIIIPYLVWLGVITQIAKTDPAIQNFFQGFSRVSNYLFLCFAILALGYLLVTHVKWLSHLKNLLFQQKKKKKREEA